LAFFPNASGKYIRYDNEKNIKITTQKSIEAENSMIFPLNSKIKADEFELNITYLLNENTLSISDLLLTDC
jgi:hypothetical protein